MNVGKLLRHDLKVQQHAKIRIGFRASVRLQPMAGLRVDLVQRQVEGGQVRRITHRNPKTPPAGDSPVCLSAWAIKIRLL